MSHSMCTYTSATRSSSDTTAEEDRLAELARDMQHSVTEEAEDILVNHLTQYSQNNGTHATFVGWIAHLHPDNVKLDPRLTLPDSTHLQMWQARGLALETAVDREARETARSAARAASLDSEVHRLRRELEEARTALTHAEALRAAAEVRG